MTGSDDAKDLLAGVRAEDRAGGAATAPSTAGALLRKWRQRRQLTQLDVAARSAVSARYLSFIENGRSRPSREMVLHLAERLGIPLRDRNHLLLAAGYAPGFSEHSLDEQDMAPVRETLERLLRAQEPYPALVADRHWNIVAANRGVDFVVRGVAPELLAPPANALRIALHPNGLAPRIGDRAGTEHELPAGCRRRPLPGPPSRVADEPAHVRHRRHRVWVPDVHSLLSPRNAGKRRPPADGKADATAVSAVVVPYPIGYLHPTGSGSTAEQIAEAIANGVVKMYLDIDMQYAYTRAVADHMFRNYDRVLKIDGGVGDKKSYDPRVRSRAAQTAMAARIAEAARQLGSAGNTLRRVLLPRSTRRLDPATSS
jgi:transcriptional regulator with XRE-family HTH domain